MSPPDEAPAPLVGGQRALLTLGLALAVFMNVLDVSIANVSIPTIAGDMAVSPTQGTWVITSFAVANAIAVPISGWLAKRVGEVRLFVVCTVLFTLFSLLCGLAFNFEMLLLARICQGAVAGPMIPLSQSLLLANYPADRRGFANGIWGMTAVVGPIAGPVLGGWITDSYHWSWIFLINLPVGVFSALVTWALLKNRETPTRRLPLDRVGLVLLIIGVGALQVMLDKGNDEAWFQSSFIITLAVIAAVTLSFFVVWEWTEPDPLVDLKLFKRRNFSIACIIVTLGFMTYFGGVVLFPLWLQNQMGYSATWAGLATASLGLLGVVFSPIIGRLTDRFDVRIIITVGMAIFAGLSFVKAGFNVHVSFEQLVLARIFWGLGLACFFIPLITLSLSGLPASQVASASGLFNFVRLVALSFGTSLSVTWWDKRQAFHDHRLTEHVTALDPATQHWLAQARDAGLSQMQALASMAQEISRQAFMLALNDMYMLAGWLFVGLAAIIWLSRPESARPGSSAAQ